jgi:ankyrin repeat protein
MKRLIERIVDTCRYNLGRVPEKEFYIEDHVERGNCGVVEALIRGNPGLSQHRDMFGNPLLLLAVCERRLEMARLLLKLGCEVNTADAHGATALHHAVDVESVEIISLLLANGASARITDENGDVPMDWAEPSRREHFQRIIEPGRRED